MTELLETQRRLKAERQQKYKATRMKNIIEKSKRERIKLACKIAGLSDDVYQEIENLEKEILALKTEKLIVEKLPELSTQIILREREIIEQSKPFKLITGIYFLIHQKQIVYVGQSVNIFSRIPQHTDKTFDDFSFIACDKKHLDKLESLYIYLFRPPLNGIGKHGYCAPMTLKSILGVDDVSECRSN